MQPEFFSALFIMLREGLEALLMVGALAAYMNKIGHSARVWALYVGAGLAVIASLLVAWLLLFYFEGLGNLAVEAAILLFAAGLMLYMSGWLFIGASAGAWQRHLRRNTDRALAYKTDFPIVAVAFIVVFREGLETAIFLAALGQMSDTELLPVGAGVLAGAGGLVLVGVVLRKFKDRLPLRPIFFFTSGFLFLMGVALVGEVVAKLQQLGLVPVNAASCGQFLSGLGVCSSREAMMMQAAVIGASTISLILVVFRSDSRVRPT